MARKETITIDMILDTAFAMTREEGFSNVTARKVAAKAGCSTQPIFRFYKNMEELWDAVYLKAVQFFQDYYGVYPKRSKTPFVDLGLAYIAFAREESHFFSLLFMTKNSQAGATKSMYEILNGNSNNVVDEKRLVRLQSYANPDDVFMRMWLFVHGIACMTLTGEYKLPDMETKELLENMYQKIMSGS